MPGRLARIGFAVAVVAVCWCLGCARLPVGEPAPQPQAAPAALPVQVKNAKDGSVELLVPAGEFPMGEGEQQKQVTLSAFYIDKAEVSNAQYAKFLEAAKQGDAQWRHPDQPASKKDHVPRYWDDPTLGQAKGDCPVVGVDWFDAYAYAKWAGKRLPTAAEWERAARGTDGRTYPWGNSPPQERLGFKANYFSTYLAADGHRATAPVGSFEAGASPVGCLNMAGNVAEWTACWHGPAPQERKLTDPRGPQTGTDRVVKGGAWNTEEDTLRTFRRWRSSPLERSASVGFRCARDAAVPSAGQ